METTVTTIPPEYGFQPYSKEEFIEMRNIMKDITTHIPNDRMGWVWSNHNKILKTNEPQPCSCGSAAANWIRAADTIRNFISQKEYQLNG
jgi:hypothetical protein